jgi:hypothetical protein
MTMTTPPVPIVCDMTNALDASDERVAEYQMLFHSPAYLGRRRTPDGIRFCFREEPGLAAAIRDLAEREKACCAFFDFVVHEHGDTITWDSTVIDDPLAHQILDEYYQLPDTAPGGSAKVFERFTDQGLTVVIADDGSRRPATKRELGLDQTPRAHGAD